MVRSWASGRSPHPAAEIHPVDPRFLRRYSNPPLSHPAPPSSSVRSILPLRDTDHGISQSLLFHRYPGFSPAHAVASRTCGLPSYAAARSPTDAISAQLKDSLCAKSRRSLPLAISLRAAFCAIMRSFHYRTNRPGSDVCYANSKSSSL